MSAGARPATGIAVLGSTGSVGTSVLRVVRQHPDRLRVVALAARGSDPEKVLRQVEELRPSLVGVADQVAAREVARRAPAGVEVVPGDEGLLAVACHPQADRVVAAMVGAAGLRPAWAAVDAGKDLALANKECLVVAGRLLMGLAAQRGVAVLPIDSEHAALHQALRGGREGEVERLVLTASGGPFWRRPAETFAAITPAEALAHPTWKMGAKITVDSATLMNKGLELIEAHFLFGLPGSRLDVVVHPQSIVHSLVEYADGSMLAQLGNPDMRTPIAHALAHPERIESGVSPLDLARIGRLDFEEPDMERFPCLRLAHEALDAGGGAPCVLNAANEVAVEAFLARRIGFAGIAQLNARVLDMLGDRPAGADVESVLALDRDSRRAAGALLERVAA